MKFKSFAWLILICAVLMLAVPFGLRVLLDRVAPREQEKSLTATEKLQSILGEARPVSATAVELLRKPPDGWTPADVAAEPALSGWLRAHARRIFPWDWSEAERTKNPAGFQKAWTNLFEELEDGCRAAMKSESKTLARVRDELEFRTAFVARLTNRLDRLQADLATNGVPTVVTDETVRRGWLWGFNRREKTLPVADVEGLRRAIATETGKLADERQAVASLSRAAAKAEAGVRELEGLTAALAKVGEAEADRLAVVVRVVRRVFRPAAEPLGK